MPAVRTYHLTERGRANQHAARKRWRLNPENRMKETEYKRRRYQTVEGRAAAASYYKSLSPEQKEKRNAYHQAWRLANPDKQKAHNKWSKIKCAYGLTRQEWEAMFAAQGLCCAGCSSTDPRSKNGWAVDHCHDTGALRGILCQYCNTALGMCEDDPHRLRRLAKYVEEKGVSCA